MSCKLTGNRTQTVNIQEIKNPDSESQVIAGCSVIS